jgi:chloramphenicol O-acetyltransferase type A
MREVDPMKTNRAESWKLYIDAPMPMVTIFKTLDISNLMPLKARNCKLNMLLCHCIALAANETPEFRLLPVGRTLIAYDQIGVNVIVANQNGGISSCDIPFFPELHDFRRAYLDLTEQVYRSCENYEIADRMIVGTSSLVRYDIDGVINMYSGIFNNPFLIWGKYRENGGRTTLQVSFQFHHVQMDGMAACEFLGRVQRHVSALTEDAI